MLDLRVGLGAAPWASGRGLSPELCREGSFDFGLDLRRELEVDREDEDWVSGMMDRDSLDFSECGEENAGTRGEATRGEARIAAVATEGEGGVGSMSGTVLYGTCQYLHCSSPLCLGRTPEMVALGDSRRRRTPHWPTFQSSASNQLGVS